MPEDKRQLLPKIQELWEYMAKAYVGSPEVSVKDLHVKYQELTKLVIAYHCNDVRSKIALVESDTKIFHDFKGHYEKILPLLGEVDIYNDDAYREEDKRTALILETMVYGLEHERRCVAQAAIELKVLGQGTGQVVEEARMFDSATLAIYAIGNFYVNINKSIRGYDIAEKDVNEIFAFGGNLFHPAVVSIIGRKLLKLVEKQGLNVEERVLRLFQTLRAKNDHDFLTGKDTSGREMN